MTATAGTLSLLIFFFGHPLLQFHQEICRVIVQGIGVPVTLRSLTGPVTGAITSAIVEAPAMGASRVGMLCLGLLIFALVIAHRAFPVARSLILFALSLLAVSFVAALVNPRFQVDPGAFTRLWTGTQFALWLALPWVCAFLVIPIEPSAVRGILWVIAVGVYAFFWSSVRLAFCLGVLHYTGPMFLTGLWFGFGPLADLLYILVFYSLAVRHASLKVWGYRAHSGIRG